MNRRNFLVSSGLAIGAGATLKLMGCASTDPVTLEGWMKVRSQFNLSPDYIHMAQMLFASHPTPVREAIAMHRENFDKHPVMYWEENIEKGAEQVKKAAARYLQVDPEEIVLTDSTTMGLALLYTGFKLKEGEEILTTTHDHYSTEKSLDFAAERTGASIRRVSLYDDPAAVSVDRVVSTLVDAVQANTRLIAVTWVHSCSGVKLPIRAIADAVKELNSKRDAADRIYFCVDGVHGFGVEDITMESMGMDFFVAGTHKWLFGPRGTGILWGKKDAWNMIQPTIPAFSMPSYGMWLGMVPEGPIDFSSLVSPGGFHAFDHRWALDAAFDYHMDIGKDKIQQRTHELNTKLKQGLEQISHVKLLTPMSTELSSGINCFEVDGLKPTEIVKKLHEQHIIASSSPYRISYARLTPCVYNTEEEVDQSIAAMHGLLA